VEEVILMVGAEEVIPAVPPVVEEAVPVPPAEEEVVPVLPTVQATGGSSDNDSGSNEDGNGSYGSSSHMNERLVWALCSSTCQWVGC
jgi:hypothetical protein